MLNMHVFLSNFYHCHSKAKDGRGWQMGELVVYMMGRVSHRDSYCDPPPQKKKYMRPEILHPKNTGHQNFLPKYQIHVAEKSFVFNN